MLNGLAANRPVFHSEADFQFALAWEIQKTLPNAQVRLESRLPRGADDEQVRGAEYIDIEIRSGLARTALELKYITKKWVGQFADEKFELKNHSALDQRRYDILKDLTRIERFVGVDGESRNGAVVVLTNDQALSSVPTRAWGESFDAAFRLHEGVFLSGALAWGAAASVGTTRGRVRQLELGGEYSMTWRAYADDPVSLKALVIEVDPE
ncbi:hypothetical protein [Agrococcus sp. KRD186]|uniref:hypothetical protein n=1 Tax=Agrococcus sp. KRD186 TaxID=2729730 RepID=UPI0019CF65E9|nr:hypothetical protein [Agrococcus sp. KRD186]